MSELTKHQREIIQAMLLGMEIEQVFNSRWVPSCVDNVLQLLLQKPTDLRIAPSKDTKIVRMSGIHTGTSGHSDILVFALPYRDKDPYSLHFNKETGAIVGSKL